MKHVKLPTVELLLSSLLFVTSVPGGGGGVLPEKLGGGERHAS